MGKGRFSSRRTGSRRRTKKRVETPLQPVVTMIEGSTSNGVGVANMGSISEMVAAESSSKPGKKKAGVSRLWMWFDKSGQSELIECEKSTIIKRTSIPARDLGILGPLFSHSFNILAREKAMVVNLEFIKAIITAEEVLLLDPLCQEVLPFVDQLRQQLPHKSPLKIRGAGQMVSLENETRIPTSGRWLTVPQAVEGGLQAELPFEFQVLEIALEIFCTYLDSSVSELERDAYPVLDELARNVSIQNLELVRSLKSNLTHLLARVQKARNEIEHLLNDNEDLARLHLTRRWIHNQQSEALFGATSTHHLRRLGSSGSGSGSLGMSKHFNGHDVGDLEMLLEFYFRQLDRTRNKILSVREYIDDTEDYVNIQLDAKRNELIQLQLSITILAFSVAFETVIVMMFNMNIQCPLYHIYGIFGLVTGVVTAACVLVLLLVVVYARWKRLLGS
ncbi:unnamed protein product [Ilex paraguariensis]|uniref:Magnesium transporter n=1 Tax=Ilex paraguariensis TaxID=185542 RepID=A0ABC8TJL6_9AQUA